MIKLYLNDGAAYVWNAEDWHTLRSAHRICGSLIGSLPSFPRQNDFMGLPMALMSEEAALLVEKGICELLESPELALQLTDKVKQEVKDLEEKTLSQQIEAFKKRKIELLSQKIDIIFAGKKQKMLSKGITDINLDKQALLEEEIGKIQNITPAQALVHLPMEHQLIATDKKKCGIDMLNPSILDEEGAVKFAVLRDLWELGYHITCGSKFGCDYLVYPGDPVKFHAMYMVKCIFHHASQFIPISVVAFGRLSVAVNKLAVLAFRNSSGQVEYQTLQWHDSNG